MSITLVILLATSAFSIAAFQNPHLREKFIFNPYLIHQQREWYRFISSGLIHADWMHLLVNMFVFYMFGTVVEKYFQSIFESRATLNFLLLYFGGMAISVLRTFSKHKTDPGYRALGASGAVSAIVFSYLLFNPLEKLCFYGLPGLCLPGIIFGALYIGYCYYAGKKSLGFVNHDAHLWGALFGFFFTILLKPQLVNYFLGQLPFLQHAF